MIEEEASSIDENSTDVEEKENYGFTAKADDVI